MKKIFAILFISFFISLSVFSTSLNDTEIINPGHFIYEKIKALQMDNQILFFTQNTPVSVGEMKLYLSKIDYENLSENGQIIYDEVKQFLYDDKNLLKTEDIKAFINLKANLEGYYKTNSEIPWTNDYFYKDNLLTVPVELGFGNLFSIQSDLFLGKNYPAMQQPSNFTNIPLKIKDFEFFFPTYAYGSTGKTYENWGWNMYLGKQGKTIGDTLTGSILYNSTFENDGYAEFSLYSDIIKYSFDVVQISSNRMDTIQGDNTERYMYIHQYDIRLFKKTKFSIFEGSLIAQPLSIRFFNPLIFMHQYGGWTDYETTENFSAYKETNFCAYFAGMLETVPVQNLRLYGIYNQIELQLPWERSQQRGHYYPNSIGFQAGGEYNLYTQNAGNFIFALEGVYTSPYMYIKQTPSASLYRLRTDMQTKQTVYSWIGSPFGPDCLAGQFKLQFIPDNKQKYEFDYVISAKGSHDFTIFDQTYEDYYSYYPSVIWWLIQTKNYDKNLDDLYTEATTLKISGIPVITNQICLKGNYKITNNTEINLKLVYSYILNNLHIHNNNQSGIEGSIAFTYSLF